MENKKTHATQNKPLFEYLSMIVLNGIFYYLISNYNQWGLYFLTDDFDIIVQVFKIAFLITITANVIFILYDENWFKAPIKLLISLLGIYLLFNILLIFPFDFTIFSFQGFSLIVKVALVLGIIALLIGALREFSKTIKKPFWK